jgi:hypothetical protein
MLLAAIGLAGCAGSADPAAVNVPEGNSSLRFVPIRVGDTNPKDARPDVPVMVELDIYQLSVPFGKVSGNDEFWKHLNEQCVDVGVYDKLFKNGVRVGVAANSEWPFFRDVIEQYPVTSKKLSCRNMPGQVGPPKAVELEMRPEMPRQDLFYYDSTNVLVGRTFDHCQDFVAITFQPAPRRPGSVRVKVCPVVRVIRQQLEYNPLNEEQEVRLVRPERIYDLSLEADVPLDHFLVVAPSSEGKWPTSIGRTFLIQDGETEQLEQVLVMVPRPYRLTGGETQMAKGSGRSERAGAE